jgi:integrase/recombinase XerD
MKSLIIKSTHYKYLLKSYSEYLQTTGYAKRTVKAWPIHAQEFLHYVENKNILHIQLIETYHVNDFVTHIKQRRNRNSGGALSGSSINNIISAVNVFAKFINSTSNYFFEHTAQRAQNDTPEKIILTVQEIKELYEATFLPYTQNSIAMGQRDRAIIALYYGCGLRRGEGVNLNITDINLQERLLFIRKAKGNKQRLVPIASKHLTDISDYIKEGREWFLQYHTVHREYQNKHQGKALDLKDIEAADADAFLVTNKGGGRFLSPEYRIKYLYKKIGLEKNITLHGLRHSIATHLMQSGMSIEDIAKFLGHSSLISTQIYTHIVNEL